jgi:hypothetical protein
MSTDLRKSCDLRERYWKSKLTTQLSDTQQFHDEIFIKLGMGMTDENIRNFSMNHLSVQDSSANLA